MATCEICRRPIPPDEQQLVHDQLTVALAPLAKIIDLSPAVMATMLAGANLGTGLCAKCFNEMNAEQPLAEFVADIAEHPTHLSNLFQFKLIKKGARHGMG